MIRILWCLAALPSVAGAQDDPFVNRLYNVEVLTEAVPDRPGATFGLEPEPAPFGREPAHRLIDPESLINLVRANIAEDTWSHTQARIGFHRGELSVVNRASVHAKIEPYLAYLRSALAKLITLDTAIVLADPAFLAKLRSAGAADRPAFLSAEQVRQLLEAAQEGKQVELVKSHRVTAHPGQRVHLEEAARHSFLRDQDVQTTGPAAALRPVPGEFVTGAGFDLRAHLEPFGGAVTLEVRADLAELEALDARKVRVGREPGVDGRAGTPAAEASIELPRIQHERIRTTVTVRSGETVVAGTLLRKGRVLAFLVTPTAFALDEKPAPEPAFEEERLLRAYDISPLTRAVDHFGAPGVDVGAAGSESRLSLGEIVELIRTRVAPESWTNKRNTITTDHGDLLVVRQKPEVLKEIDRTLTALLQSRTQMMTTEARIVGLRKGARAEWEKEIPGLGAGGYFVEEAKLEKLLGEAGRDPRVRLIAAGEVTGFPRERVHAAAMREENLLRDFVPQATAGGPLYDPAVRTLLTGFVLDVWPRPEPGGDRISVGLSASILTRELHEIETASPGVGPFQTPRVEGPRWSSDVVCVRGKWTVVALETRGSADEREDVALFLRVRSNSLK